MQIVQSFCATEHQLQLEIRQLMYRLRSGRLTMARRGGAGTVRIYLKRSPLRANSVTICTGMFGSGGIQTPMKRRMFSSVGPL